VIKLLDISDNTIDIQLYMRKYLFTFVMSL